MGKAENLTNQKFGRLTALERDIEMQKKVGRTCWKCRCECGNIVSVRSVDLKNGHTRSCGCLYKETCQKMGQQYGPENGKQMGLKYGGKNADMLIKDKVGQRFGRLTVIERDKNSKNPLKWICKCDCGNIVSVSTGHLTTGHTQSCGCLLSDFIPTLVQLAKEHNTTHLQKGEKYGRLTIIELDTERSGKGNGSFYSCKCDCGKIISVKTSSLLEGHTRSCGCLNSKGEFIIGQIFKQLQIKNVQQKTFPNLIGISAPLKFDFYLPDYNCCIEFQGKQHYQPVELFGGEEQFNQQQKYDNKKRQYCLQNNIKLIEIPYWDLNKINENYILDLLQNL